MSSIPFITYTPSDGFQLTPQTMSYLTSISQTPVAVLSIVGNYRTGKSFFINRVLLNKANGEGFPVGPSINPCTKGLWLWNQPLDHQNPDISNDVKVLLIDTEGFGGIDQNLSHNSRIGLFSLLLSSFFIYNSLGIIDENSLNSLSLIVSLGQEIMKQGESNGIFPSFLWVLRDFALQMVNGEGESMSNKEYLEKALEINGKMNEGKAKTRKVIREIFAERDCLTMVRPVANERDLQKMDCLNEKNFRPEFVEQIKKARNMVFSKITPKKINGKVITAGILLELCKNFITVINGEKIPDIKSTWVYLCRNQMNATFSGFYLLKKFIIFVFIKNFKKKNFFKYIFKNFNNF